MKAFVARDIPRIRDAGTYFETDKINLKNLFFQKKLFYLQFPNMNTDRSLNKPYVNDVTL